MSNPYRYTKGFSLIEVLVALVVLTVGVTAALSLSARNIDNAHDLENRTIAHWVAQNELARMTIQPESINGDSQGVVNMASRDWFWEREVEQTLDDTINRVTIRVYSDEERSFFITQLTGYLPMTAL